MKVSKWRVSESVIVAGGVFGFRSTGIQVVVVVMMVVEVDFNKKVLLYSCSLKCWIFCVFNFFASICQLWYCICSFFVLITQWFFMLQDKRFFVLMFFCIFIFCWWNSAGGIGVGWEILFVCGHGIWSGGIVGVIQIFIYFFVSLLFYMQKILC